jgi:hypothetical protein
MTTESLASTKSYQGTDLNHPDGTLPLHNGTATGAMSNNNNNNDDDDDDNNNNNNNNNNKS